MRIYNIQWETDGDEDARKNLPDEIAFAPDDPILGVHGKDSYDDWLDEIENALSDMHGFLHGGFAVSDDVKSHFRKREERKTM